MTLLDWLPALSSTGILAIVAAVAAPAYKAAIEKSLQHKLDKDLETLRSQMRRDEEHNRADLKARDEQIAALRGGALSGSAARQAQLDNRRLEAVQNLWAAVVELGKLKFAAQMAGVMKMGAMLEKASKQTADGKKVRDFAETVWKSFGLETPIQYNAADRERPFLSPLAWALFSAYRQVLYQPVAQFALMRAGMGPEAIKSEELIVLVKKALPHMSDYMDKFGVEGIHHLISPLEEKLLATVQADLADPRSNEASIKEAAEILKAADEAAAAMKAVPQVPAVPGI